MRGGGAACAEEEDMGKKMELLRQIFGYQSFREGQERLVDAALAGRDALGIMPTGAGKSICYQLPALLLPGITLVVSPLISLMRDQVRALVQNGVRAAYLNSSLNARQYQRALQNARQGMYKLIYVAPERLLTEQFLSFAREAEISMLTVDEAHCVSQWGQDFRPSYLEIARFVELLPRRPVLTAFTATATPKVREDILELLRLQDPEVVLTGFDRKNLFFEVQRPKGKLAAVLRLLGELEGKSGIVYCSTRKTVEQLCDELQKRGFEATRYHAGLSDEERKENQEAFIFDRSRVMVATNAFGMGIDKSNVGFVIHYNMPKDLESYYQEAGRAGRDGSPARCVLLYSGRDVITNQFLIDHAEEQSALTPEQRELVQKESRRRLKEMTFYATTQDCLRGYILRYFGEKAERFCGDCGNCTANVEWAEAGDAARALLAAVAEQEGRYGVRRTLRTLLGAEGGLAESSHWGALRGESETQLRLVCEELLRRGALVQSDGEYPVLSTGDAAVCGQILREGLRLRMLKRTAPSPARQEQPEDQALFERLRALRAEIARVQGVPAFVVFTDATLRDLCAKQPRRREELLAVQGISVKKAERYGEQFLAALEAYGREKSR